VNRGAVNSCSSGYRRTGTSAAVPTVAGALLLLLCGSFAAAPQPPQQRSARAAAPVDLTGYWVSVVTEDWRFRMMTPAKGDYSSVPLNNEGRRVADAWNPNEDPATGGCKAFGVGAIMRVPGRVRITWQDDNTLRIDTDAGAQTRSLRFGAVPAPAGSAQWQGHSIASWEGPQGRGQAQRGSLKVVTTRMRPGYLRSNGVPYSENAVITEYFDHHADFGVEWFTVTTIVDDPTYLSQPFITSTDFKKEPDGARWAAVPCEPRP
jgi:hypothetical protein